MPPIWAVSCSGCHCVNIFFVTVTLTFYLVTWKSIVLIICQSWSIYLWRFMILGLTILELSSGNLFTVMSHCDLDLWPSDLKINKGYIPVMINVPIKYMVLCVSIFEISSGYYFTALSHFDLDLWPSDLNINRGNLQVMINVPMKFHDPRRKHSWVIIRKSLNCFDSLWPWPLT